MTRTEFQKEAFDTTSRESGGRAGVARYATHTPTYTPPTSTYPYGSTTPTAGPSHRTAIIGATGLALLLAAMGGIAFVRYQDTAAPAATTAAVVTVPQSVYDSQVPTAPLRVTVPQSVYDSQVPAAAVEVAVPQAAKAALAAETAGVSVTVPQSVYDSQVPAAAVEVAVPQAATAHWPLRRLVRA